jgi:hypothetical protein
MRYALGLGLLLFFASQSAADQVTVVNKANGAIYRLYAWPTDLVARSFNILNTPLQRSSETVVNVDNSYQDCQFTFQYDLNNPADKRKKNYRRRSLQSKEVDICKNDGKVYLGYDF